MGRMTHEAMEALGAKCHLCPLRRDSPDGPCASELIPGTDRIAVAEVPGHSEVVADRPLAGRAGMYFDAVLQRIGAERREVSSTHLVACTAPGGDLRAYESKLRVRNRKRKAAGKDPHPTPTACCAPRMHNEVAPFLRVLPLGSSPAYHLVPHLKGGILGIRGRLVTVPTSSVDPRPLFGQWTLLEAEGLKPSRVPGRQILATVSPGYALKNDPYQLPFMVDVHRAWRWWRGEIREHNTRMVLRPSVEQMEAALLRRGADFPPIRFRGHNALAFDWESDGIHAMQANPRCLGWGTTEWALIVPYQPVQWRRQTEARAVAVSKRVRAYLKADPSLELVDVQRQALAEVMADPPGDYLHAYQMDDGSLLPLYDEHEQRERDRITKHALTDRALWKVGWNSGSYDRILTERYYGIRPDPHIDLILAKRSVLPELRHDLGTAGSIYCDLHDWKGGKTAVTAKTDELLWRYCGWDNVAPSEMLEPLFTALDQRHQAGVYALDVEMQSAGVGMHRVGMGVDQVERSRLDVLLASPGPATVRDPKTGKDTQIPRGLIHGWILRCRQILEASGADVSGIVKRTAKADREHAEWQINASLEEREEADLDKHDEAADIGVLPSIDELGLDALAFNPMSHPQLRAVLFEEWRLPIPTDLKQSELYTSSGEISTGDAVLRRLMVDRSLTPEQRGFIRAIRMARRHGKVWGTYVRPLRPPVGDITLDKGCRVWGDGRLHAVWNTHCYDDQTEILTPRGWVLFRDLRPDDRVAQWWQDTGRIDFAAPTAHYADAYDGHLEVWEGRHLNLHMTPGHRVVLEDATGGRREFRAGPDFQPTKAWKTIHAGHYEGPGLKWEGQRLSADAMRVLAMVQADGCILRGSALRLSFRKQRKIDRCEQLLRTVLGVNAPSPLKSPDRPETHFYLPVAAVPPWLLGLLGSGKCFGPWLLDCDAHQADALLDEVWHWDAVAARRNQYASTQEADADWLQALLTLRGVRANKRTEDRSGIPKHADLHHINVSRQGAATYISSKTTFTRRRYAGTVYCVEVPSSWVVVRRAGKVTISGNTPITGRFSTSGPNVQNLPPIAKNLVIAAPGNLLVGADMDQLELRIAAARWGAARYLEAFAQGLDPHQMTMEAVFGLSAMMAFQGAPSTFGRKDFAKGSEFEKMRKLAKAIQYASQYAAGCAVREGRVDVVDTLTVYRLVTSAEDKKTGQLVFPKLTEMQVAAMHDNWLKGCPEFMEGWLRELAAVQAHGCLYEPITGRRRDFEGQRAQKLNEIVNFPIQSSGAGIMNKIMVRLVEAIPFEAWGPGTGIINQCHDSITVECPEREAPRIEGLLNEIMNVEETAYPGVLFSAEAAIAWRDRDPLGRGQSRWGET